ncbi:patatin-like phospholipase family protein [Methylobacterium hispanicum]|uniref:patatin-like phospholipase family protein n=1 Tax=Methylobacterium hispanicum TaxID=270350 RepID=UPI002F320D22
MTRDAASTALAAPAPPGPGAEAAIVDAATAIAEEFGHLHLTPGQQPTALCLSGGGIRSAAFCLGVVQAFARYRLLPQFQYLSTVSGGGYTGAWLTRLIAERSETAAAQGRPLDMDALQDEIAAPADRAETNTVRGLRRYTSYLTPSRGFASLDTWAGITLWLRNTLINWFVFLPVFGALAGLPILYAAATYAVAGASGRRFDGVAAHVGYAGALALFIAVLGSIVALPSHTHPDDRTDRREAYGLVGSETLVRIVLPMLLWCLLAAAAVAPRADDPCWAQAGWAIFLTDPPQGLPCPATSGAPMPDLDLPLLSFITCLAAYAGAFVWICWKYRRDGELLDLHAAPFVKGIVAWVLSSGLSSAFLYLGITLAQERHLLWVILAGPLWVAVAETLRTTLYVGMRHSGLRNDSDREWLARINGSKLRLVVGLCLGCTVIVLGGSYLTAQSGALWSSLVGGGVASGSIVALLGSSARTAVLSQVARVSGSPAGPGGAGKLAWPAASLVKGAMLVFPLTVFALIGRGLALGIGAAASLVSGPVPGFPTLAAISLAAVLGLAGLALLLGWAINLNRFSMHAVYRNRLIRAFLGSGRPWENRRPDRFTQFDPCDNIRMADTVTGRSPLFLFPVVNVAMNRTSGRDTARAERKAEAFTITPFRCGAATLPSPVGTPARVTEQSPRAGAYAPTRGYAAGERDTGARDQEQGITLGTAITISGAAASPNMGYHSSPLTAFVMTLCNVRLGAWLPNPATRRTVEADRRALLRSSGPRNEVPTLLRELTGRSDIDGDYLYLSDGGHFENLGVYEMLRRRCSLIVAIDAGQDKDYAYEDLARLKQSARIDLGVEITFVKEIAITQRLLAPQGALATVRYPATDALPAAEGRLLYLKSWLPEQAPVELLAYRIRNADFPHESTGNQFFTESDFESYRHLGNYLARAVIEQGLPGTKPGGPPPLDALEALFANLSRLSRPAGAPLRPPRTEPPRTPSRPRPRP